MTRRTTARLAGFTFLFYFVAGISHLVLSNRAITGEGIAGKLASIAQHATDMRLVVLLTLLMSLSALILAVTLHAITRVEDPELAMLAFTCRVIEGVSGVVNVPRTLGLLWLATAAGANAPDPAGARVLGSYLLRGSGVGAIFFAVGSTLFCFLLLRGRMIPGPLAWIGLVTSVLLVVGLPLQLVGVLPNSATWFLWLPLAAFEIPFAFLLLIKGVALPPQRQPA